MYGSETGQAAPIAKHRRQLGIPRKEILSRSTLSAKIVLAVGMQQQCWPAGPEQQEPEGRLADLSDLGRCRVDNVNSRS